MNNNETKAVNVDVEINKLRDAVLAIEDEAQRQKRAREFNEAQQQLDYFSSVLGLDLSTLSPAVLDNLTPALTNFTHVASNPMVARDLRARVEHEVRMLAEDAKRMLKRKYVLTTARRKDGSICQPVLTTPIGLHGSNVPLSVKYSDLRVSILDFAGVEQTDHITGLNGEREALALLQTATAAKTYFNVEPSGQSVPNGDLLSLCEAHGITEHADLDQYVVVMLANRRAVKQAFAVKLRDVFKAQMSMFTCKPVAGDEIRFVEAVYPDKQLAAAVADRLTKADRHLPQYKRVDSLSKVFG